MTQRPPDRLFALPRLAAIYDIVDGARDDLDAYVAIVEGLGARSVLDVGCGTGSLAVRLAARGLVVVGVDPAGASLDVARSKVAAERVRWIVGDATVPPPVDLDPVDVATMTGNVAQVFTTDEAWSATLDGIQRWLRPGGTFVFESRRPQRRAWEAWNPSKTLARFEVAGSGAVTYSVEVLDVRLPLVSFRQTYVFEADGETLTSDSTLRFRTHDELEHSLTTAGFVVDEVRDAPDRPGRELVFIAHRR